MVYLKKGISGWAFVDRDPDTCFALAKQHGFEGVEPVLGNVGPVQYTSTKHDMLALRAKAEQYGLSLYSLVCDQCWEDALSSTDPARQDRARKRIEKQVELAAYLGCSTVLILPGIVEGFNPDDEVVPYDVVYERAFKGVQSLIPVAEQYGITLALENVWNKCFLSPLEMRDFIDSFHHPLVKAYFDVGNVLINGYPEHWINILSHRIDKIHFKDFRKEANGGGQFVDLLEGNVNYPSVMAQLEKIGYDGWVTAEVFPDQTDPERVLRVNSVAMDHILQKN